MAQLGEPKRAVILLGPPGSGKTSVAAPEIEDSNRLLRIDADRVQEQLSGFKPELAPSHHEAGSEIADEMLLGRALSEGRNFEVQWTGKNGDKVEAAIKGFKDAGYRVELYYTHVTAEESAKRVIGRFRHPSDGRYVPPEYALSMGDKPGQTFERVKGLTDRWVSYDNMVLAGEKATVRERGGSW